MKIKSVTKTKKINSVLFLSNNILADSLIFRNSSILKKPLHFSFCFLIVYIYSSYITDLLCHLSQRIIIIFHHYLHWPWVNSTLH